MKNKNFTIIIVLIIIALAVVPLMIHPNAEFGGADGRAEDAITEINPTYQPWANSLIELPSGEVESLLFSLQAGIGG
jgi:cobalt/nickel transport protein